MTPADIQREFFAVHALLQPAGADIKELLSAGIEPSKVLSLYPLDMVELAELLQACLHSPAQVWRFANEQEQASNSELAAIYDRLSPEHWDTMRKDTLALFFVSKNFNAMAEAFRQVQQDPSYPTTAYSMVSDALMSAAQVLWLAANWSVLAELSGCEGTFCKQLVTLRESLSNIDTNSIGPKV